MSSSFVARFFLSERAAFEVCSRYKESFGAKVKKIGPRKAEIRDKRVRDK